MSYIYGYLLLINALGFVFMLKDKVRAKKKQLRIPERALLTLSIIGGSGGTVLGMYLFRHKIRNRNFFYGLPIILCLHIAIAVCIAQLIKK
ncbi:MAG: DUF1294 domain-containing protein [Ruminococcaceae bacterium]|nr:DUF1294 domain-containing protein [Oscillospiraceae bacterium]